MKASLTFAILFGAAGLAAVACSTGDSERPSESIALPPHFDPSAASGTASAPLSEAEVERRTAFDPAIAARGEALAQPVPPELEQKLEADYQASLKRTDDENALLHPGNEQPVDFGTLFQRIRVTMPPARGALLAQYLNEANKVTDPTERSILIARLASPELDNVH